MSCRVSSTLSQPFVPGAIDAGQFLAAIQHTAVAAQLSCDRLLLSQIVAHMRSCLPFEGVGLVATVPGAAGPIADSYYPGTNVSASPTRFNMDPREVHRAIEDMARRGTSLGAVVHSHPTTIATPSAIDLREATISDALSIIVGFEPRFSIRAWRLLFSPSGRAFDAVECPIVTTTTGTGARERSTRRAVAGSVMHEDEE